MGTYRVPTVVYTSNEPAEIFVLFPGKFYLADFFREFGAAKSRPI